MSHQNCCGATNPAFTNQYVPSNDPGYCCLIPQHDAPAVTDDRPSPAPDDAPCASDTAGDTPPTAETTTSGVASNATTATDRHHDHFPNKPATSRPSEYPVRSPSEGVSQQGASEV
jgi:hypothetical protein